MSFIFANVAHFEINEDNKSGQIVFQDGNRSRTCFTKWQARQLAKSVLDLSIDEPEYKAIIETIDNSCMIESNSEIEKITDYVAEVNAKISSGCAPRM